MVAVIGVFLLAAFLLLERWTYNHFRRPAPPAWTRRGVYSQPLIGIILLALFGGASFVAFFLEHRAELSFTLVDGVLIVLIGAATAHLHQRLRRQWRAFLQEPSSSAAAAGSVPGLAMDDPPPRDGPGGREAA